MENKLYTLITGASEGLGKRLAIECATRGMNLVLVALAGEALSGLGDFLKRTFDVEVKVFASDLSDESNCYHLFKEIDQQRLHINILINNAGIGGTAWFEDESAEQYASIIKLNVLATTLITRLFLKILEENTPSYILNTGSMAGFFHLPKKQVYCGTKSYVYSFSRSLQKELKRLNIHVSVLCPGGMNTSIGSILTNKSSPLMNRLSIMDPEDVAPLAIDGLLRRKKVIVPGLLNRWFLFMDKILPGFLKKLIMSKTTGKINPKLGYNIYYNTARPALVKANR
jgi:short-subunit dehydrogenase